MATNFNADLLNPEGTVVLESHVVSFTGTTPANPVAVNKVSPVGTITAGAMPTVQLSSGTGAQVLTTRDVDTYTLWTSDATNNIASAAVAISADNSTYTTLYTASVAAAINNLGAVAVNLFARVPAGWYLKITLVHSAAMPTTAYY